MALGTLPLVSALSDQDPFPDIRFSVFNQFVTQHFSSKITLATVLTVLFSVIENPELLNLHARQQNPVYEGENKVNVTGWIKAFARGLESRLDDDVERLFHASDRRSDMSGDAVTNHIGMKLDALSKLLHLYPYNQTGQFQKLNAVSKKEIEPVYVICPNAVECETMDCNPRSLVQAIGQRDIPKVTLIRGIDIHDDVQVLTGRCPDCDTRYFADHERAQSDTSGWNKVYLNSAKYIKIGSSIWVDRVFSGAVVNGIYSFHASASAFAEFWNDSFWTTQRSNSRKVSRRQIWQAFVQESVRMVAAGSNQTLVLQDSLKIVEVTKAAFDALGSKGIIQNAQGHACSECTHAYKAVADIITGDDPAALVGHDENRNVPVLVGEGADLAAQHAAEARQHAIQARQPGAAAEAMDVDNPRAPVVMAVVDGVVMGPKHCTFEDCIAELQNSRGGVFCSQHLVEYGAKCRIHGCNNQKIAGIQTCEGHRVHWNRHLMRHNRQSYLGVRRMLRRTEEENLPWIPDEAHDTQAHDEEAVEPVRTTHFIAPRFYCVETICAPCGVVIAWAKFAKSESPTNILRFLHDVYPTPASRPSYIAIDKACLLLRTSIRNGSWEMWKDTTRFIVDTYHYVNHRTTDFLCRTWCNPAPLNGSAPNLVVVENDRHGRPHYKRAFNTQVICLQMLDSKILTDFCDRLVSS
jgi:CxC5 like cysteine cluster associated with KDZ transposases/CxC6 like cysteine cluster associated with KDZ transposases